MNIFFAINKSYVQHLLVAIASILHNNKTNLIFNVCSADLDQVDKKNIEDFVGNKAIVNFFDVQNVFHFGLLPDNIPHTTIETYFRYLIPYLDLENEKALYLDADTIVKGDIRELWETDISNVFAAGVHDTYIEDTGYKSKINFDKDDLYVNAGVLLLNLKKIRETFDSDFFFKRTIELADRIEYQDQDVINIIFKGKIKSLPKKFNYTFRDVIKRPKKNIFKAKILHYTGDRKPWDYMFCSGNPAELYYYRYLLLTPYKNTLLSYFKDMDNVKFVLRSKSKWLIKGSLRRIKRLFVKKNETRKVKKDKIKVALLIDEFFGGAGTAYGGYGFLARRYIAKYIPDSNIELDVILGLSRKNSIQEEEVDGVRVYRLPNSEHKAKRWLEDKNYDVFFSIELTSSSYEVLKLDQQKKRLLLWIQDPRPWYEWREINTVKLFPETCYWDTRVYEYVNYLNWLCKVRFITQGKFLIPKARDLYRLNDDLNIDFVPNPVEIDFGFDPKKYEKKNMVIFLGRIESVKRGWLFCEIAKRLPNLEFYLLGQTFREKGKNTAIMSKYKSLKNLHFVGHVDGEEKINYLKDAKILVNTSIHEALPISFLEALSYGTLIVSNRNPEQLTEKFGEWVGDVFGDGFDKIEVFVDAIERILSDEELRKRRSVEAVDYIRKVHNVEKFTKTIKELLLEEANK